MLVRGVSGASVVCLLVQWAGFKLCLSRPYQIAGKRASVDSQRCVDTSCCRVARILGVQNDHVLERRGNLNCAFLVVIRLSLNMHRRKVIHFVGRQ